MISQNYRQWMTHYKDIARLATRLHKPVPFHYIETLSLLADYLQGETNFPTGKALRLTFYPTMPPKRLSASLKTSMKQMKNYRSCQDQYNARHLNYAKPLFKKEITQHCCDSA